MQSIFSSFIGITPTSHKTPISQEVSGSHVYKPYTFKGEEYQSAGERAGKETGLLHT